MLVGKNFGEQADVFVKRGPNRIGAMHKKVALGRIRGRHLH
jgi:hypothetical protein